MRHWEIEGMGTSEVRDQSSEVGLRPVGAYAPEGGQRTGIAEIEELRKRISLLRHSSHGYEGRTDTDTK